MTTEIIGYIASALVLLTFMAKDMRLLRIGAILSNVAFIAYGILGWLPPVFFLHLILLPLNIVRLNEVRRKSYRLRANHARQGVERPSTSQSTSR